MTAPNTNSAASDNSIFQGTENRSGTPANDRALVQIIEYAYETTLAELDIARYNPRSKLVESTDVTAPQARLIREVTTDCYTPVADAGE